MQTRKLGCSNLNFSKIELGTWGMGGASHEYSFGPQDDNESLSTIHSAIDQGINCIDTAPFYGMGHSEEVVGKAIRNKRDKVFIATKCGVIWDDDDNYEFSLTKDSINSEIERSLNKEYNG